MGRAIAIASERSGLVVGSVDGDLPLDAFVLVHRPEPLIRDMHVPTLLARLHELVEAVTQLLRLCVGQREKHAVEVAAILICDSHGRSLPWRRGLGGHSRTRAFEGL